MSGDNYDSYRPRSPDLSAFVPPANLQRLPSYHQSTTSDFPAGYPLNHRGSYDASPFFSPSTAAPTTSYFGSQPHAPSQHSFSAQNYPAQTGSIFQSPSTFSHPPPQFPDSQPQSVDQMARPQRRKASVNYDEAETEDSHYTPDESLAPTRSSKKRKSTDPTSATDVKSSSAGPSQGIEVKTKFPVARIKRIMQADEDVGKVAQATPTAVSKALELFIISLVMKGAAEARIKSSKRVTAAHLKAALMKESQFDFLTDICSHVADAPEKKGGKAKTEDEDSEDGGVKKAGKGKGPRRKSEKMVEDSD